MEHEYLIRFPLILNYKTLSLRGVRSVAPGRHFLCTRWQPQNVLAATKVYDN